MNFKIENTSVYGLDKAIIASGNPMRTTFETHQEMTEKDLNRGKKLGTVLTGTGHDNFLKGIIVQMNLTAPLYFWKQAQRYHWFDFISSQSTMHCLLKFDIKSQCVDETNDEIIKIMEKLVSEYNKMEDTDPNKINKWRELVASLPSGFCLGATMTTNYQQLKTMYQQRKNHRLKEWHEFCSWCDSLPYFKELTQSSN